MAKLPKYILRELLLDCSVDTKLGAPPQCFYKHLARGRYVEIPEEWGINNVLDG
jgi:hypothetical protein